MLQKSITTKMTFGNPATNITISKPLLSQLVLYIVTMQIFVSTIAVISATASLLSTVVTAKDSCRCWLPFWKLGLCYCFWYHGILIALTEKPASKRRCSCNTQWNLFCINVCVGFLDSHHLPKLLVRLL